MGNGLRALRMLPAQRMETGFFGSLTRGGYAGTGACRTVAVEKGVARV